MEIFEVPLYDDDLLKLAFRLTLNLLVVGILVRFVYNRYANNRKYLFPFVMLNVLVFFICFTLKKFELDLGMALGLFAIFGILRYRTNTIPIKEMTYLFCFIGLGIINSLSNKKLSYAELILTDVCIVVIAAWLERGFYFKQERKKSIVYDRMDLVRPENHEELIDDLQQRMGIPFSRIDIGKINYVNNTVSIDAFYHPEGQEGQDFEMEDSNGYD